MTDKIFEVAQRYEFDRIKEYILQGGTLNICNEEGYSLLTCFVQGYFEFGEKCFLNPKWEEGCYFCSGEYEVLNTPLDKRNSGIKMQMDWLLSCDADINLCSMVNGQTETALMQAVRFCDPHMTKYLLQHGADPKIRLFSEKVTGEYWLLEDLDCRMMDIKRDEEAKVIESIAQLLWIYGLRGWTGLCIEMDDEKGVSQVHGLIAKY